MNGKAYLDLVRRQPCSCCGAAAPSFSHHPREGQGGAQKADDFLAIALCYECHQGVAGIHGNRSLMRIYKKSEMDMIAVTVRNVVNYLEAV